MKSDQARVASKYAEAVIDLAFATGGDAPQIIGQDLSAINKVVADTPDFTVVLNHPSINSDRKKELLLSLFGAKVHYLTSRLLGLLADKRRLDLLAAIENEYFALLRARQNIVTAHLVSAEPLLDVTVSQIKEKLAAKLGKRLEIDVKLDPSLLGGLVLRVGDQVLDGSLKGKLQVLERALLSV